MIIGIVAIAKNYAIGKDGKLPWHYSSDLKFFKKTTTGNAVVMGFNTWRSIGRALPNRLNIVLSRSAQIEDEPNLIFLRSRHEVLELSQYLKCNVYVIGGAKTYESFADSIDEWIVTEVPIDVEGADTFMPENFLDGYEIEDLLTLDDALSVKTFRRMANLL